MEFHCPPGIDPKTVENSRLFQTWLQRLYAGWRVEGEVDVHHMVTVEGVIVEAYVTVRRPGYEPFTRLVCIDENDVLLVVYNKQSSFIVCFEQLDPFGRKVRTNYTPGNIKKLENDLHDLLADLGVEYHVNIASLTSSMFAGSTPVWDDPASTDKHITYHALELMVETPDLEECLNACREMFASDEAEVSIIPMGDALTNLGAVRSGLPCSQNFITSLLLYKDSKERL